jgi:hypothetical protein
MVTRLTRAIFALVVGVSVHASAQTCSKPSLKECVDDKYRASECFKSYSGYCTEVINSGFTKGAAKLPQVDRLLPVELGNTVGTVGEMPPIEPVGSNFQGLSTQVSGLVALNQIVYRKNFANLSDAEGAHAKALDQWKSNGPVIRSCQEYIHEKYLDYSEFEARAGVHGGDFRAIMNDAYGATGIADRTLFSSSKKPLAPIFNPEQRVEKNAYFTFSPGPYPKGQAAYEFTSSAAKSANNPAARKFYAPSDAWHVDMSKRLAAVNDDILNEQQVAQRDFSDLLADRQHVWDSYQADLAQLPQNKELDAQVAASLRQLDARIEKALIDAEGQGCLDLKGVSCDWSPRRYHDMVQATMNARRQADLSECIDLTAGDFSDDSFVRNASKMKIDGLDGDYTLDPDVLAQYLAAYREYLRHLPAPAPIDPSTGLTRRSGRHDDSGEFGDRSLFAGALAYGGGWNAQWGTRFCDADVSFDGYATASAWVFGTGGEIAHAEGLLGTEADDIHLFLLVRVGGAEVYRTDTRTHLMLDFQIANPTFYDGTIAEATATFVIVVVPVTVSGGISANVGIEFRLGGQVSRDCAVDAVGIDLLGTVKPYAGLSGFASLAVGIPGLRVGIRGSLVIARIELPLRGQVGVYLSSSNQLFLRMGLGLSIRVQYLDGRLSLFGELGPCPFCVRGEVTIFSWTGFGTPEVPIFNESFDVPLATL